MFALQLFNIHDQILLDDTYSLACYYHSNRNVRFQQEPRSVVFVDIGGYSTKISGFYFQHFPNGTIANETIYEWTESFGGFLLAKVISEKKNISIHKAEKILMNSKSSTFLHLIENEIIEFRNFLNSALSTVNVRIGRLDEIQLIGGASSFKFLVEIVKEAAGTKTKVLKDFNSNEVIAFGGAIALLLFSDVSPFPDIKVYPISKFNLSITCNQSHQFCDKGFRCKDKISEQGSQGCEVVELTIPSNHLSKGVISTNIQYKLTNLSYSNTNSIENNSWNFRLLFSNPILDDVEWCVSEQCQNINFEKISSVPHFYSNPKIYQQLIEKFDEENARIKILPQVQKLVQTLAYLVKNADKMLEEGFLPFTEEKQKNFEKYLIEYHDGKFEEMNKRELLETKRELEKIFNSLLTQKRNENKENNQKNSAKENNDESKKSKIDSQKVTEDIRYTEL